MIVIAGIFAAGAAAGIASALQAPSDVVGGITGLTAIPFLLAAFAMNIVARIYATYRAYKGGELWVMPWLRPLVSRWLPEKADSLVETFS